MGKRFLYSTLLLLFFSGVVLAQIPSSFLSQESVTGNHNPANLSTVGGLLYEQFGTSTWGLLFQNYSTTDIFDCEAADDFIVPDGKIWVVDEVVIDFYTTLLQPLPQPNTSITVRFYDDNGGIPGTIIEEFVHFNINTDNFVNSGTIPLPSPVSLQQGTKWLSIQVNTDFPNCYWHIGNDATYFNDAQFINPGGGFGIGSDWISLPVLTSPDNFSYLDFGIYGIESPAVPFPIIGSIIAFLGIGTASFMGLRRRKK